PGVPGLYSQSEEAEPGCGNRHQHLYAGSTAGTHVRRRGGSSPIPHFARGVGHGTMAEVYNPEASICPVAEAPHQTADRQFRNRSHVSLANHPGYPAAPLGPMVAESPERVALQVTGLLLSG